MNEVGINSKLLDFLGQNNIVVHFFNYYGGYSGTFYPKDQYMSGKLLIKQVEAFQNNRMKIAKAIVKGIGINIYEVCYHTTYGGTNDDESLNSIFPYRLNGCILIIRDASILQSTL